MCPSEDVLHAGGGGQDTAFYQVFPDAIEGGEFFLHFTIDFIEATTGRKEAYQR